MIAYHGTTKANAESICRNGFSSEKEGSNGNHFGNGVYLATTKKRAKAYGKHVVSVEIDDSRLFLLEDWYAPYIESCTATFENGTAEKDVNSVVGEKYKTLYTELGYTGIALPVLLGTGKEMVIYDSTIIKSCWQ